MSLLPLPNEILVNIFCNLKFEDVISCVLVNRQFHNLINSNCDRLQKLEVKSIAIRGENGHTTISINSNIVIEITPLYVDLQYISTASYAILQSLFRKFFFSQANCAVKKLDKVPSMRCWSYPITIKKEAFIQLLKFILSNLKAEKWVTLITERELSFLTDCIHPKNYNISGRPSIVIPQITANFARFCNTIESSEIAIAARARLEMGVNLLDTTNNIVLKTTGIWNMFGVAQIIREWLTWHRGIKKLEITGKNKNINNWGPQQMTIDAFSIFMQRFNTTAVLTTNTEEIYHLNRRVDDRILKISYSTNSMFKNRGRAIGHYNVFCAQEIVLG